MEYTMASLGWNYRKTPLISPTKHAPPPPFQHLNTELPPLLRRRVALPHLANFSSLSLPHTHHPATPLLKKLHHFVSSFTPLHESVKHEPDPCLKEVLWFRHFPATVVRFPANDGGGWQGGPLFYHFHVFSSCFNFIFLISFPFSCSSSATT